MTNLTGDLTRFPVHDPALTPAQREQRFNRKLLLQEQGQRLAEAYAAGQLRAMLERLRGGTDGA